MKISGGPFYNYLWDSPCFLRISIAPKQHNVFFQLSSAHSCVRGWAGHGWWKDRYLFQLQIGGIWKLLWASWGASIFLDSSAGLMYSQKNFSTSAYLLMACLGVWCGRSILIIICTERIDSCYLRCNGGAVPVKWSNADLISSVGYLLGRQTAGITDNCFSDSHQSNLFLYWSDDGYVVVILPSLWSGYWHFAPGHDISDDLI